MNADFLQRMMTTLEQDEGYRQHPYRCTANKLTVAIGRNLESKGITRSEALHMLRGDIMECWADMVGLFGDDWGRVPVGVQEALINMRFQLGPGGFRGFRKMVAAVRRCDFKSAADEAMDSNWYTQTPERARRVVDLIRRAG